MACWRSPAAKGNDPYCAYTAKSTATSNTRSPAYSTSIPRALSASWTPSIWTSSWRSRCGMVRLLRSPPGDAWWISKSALIVWATQVYTVRLKLAIMMETLIIIAKLVSRAAVATVQRRNAYTRLSSASSPSTPSQCVKVCRPTRVMARNTSGIRQETPSTRARQAW